MRMNKFLMLGIAGLAFAACSNEEEFGGNNTTPEGEGAVTVKIVSPAMTKAVEGTTGADQSTVKVQGDLIITLECDGGPLTKTVTVGDDGAQAEVTFWNVTNPTKVTASMNDGTNDYTAININNASEPNMQALPVSIPVYGEDIPEPTNNTRPGVAADDDENENANEDGSDVNKNYTIYTATVNLEIPVARLEVSGITHVDHSGAACKFKDLKITGVYMDNIRMTSDDACGNYRFPGDATGGSETDSPLSEAIDPAESFVAGTYWPHDVASVTTPVFGYNFYSTEAGKIEENPSFKIRFTYSDETGTVTNQTRYAYITKYLKGGEEIALQNGHIYKIESAEITDDNLVPGEDGEDLYAVTVTVVEATWTVDVITAEWAN